MHGRRHQRGIDTARKECTYWHVAHELTPHGPLERLSHRVDGFAPIQQVIAYLRQLVKRLRCADATY